MALIDPKTPLRSDLERMCGGNQRLVKAFEKLFQVLPTISDANLDAIEAAQITADTAVAQSLLAVSLIEAINQLAELLTTEPKQVCTCQSFDDLSTRTEHAQQDVIFTSIQMTESNNINLEVA